MKAANGSYIRPVAKYSWWFRKKTYLSYMMRELSSLFIGIFSLIMVMGLFRLSQGAIEFNAWINTIWNFGLIGSLVIFIFAVYHSYTWFIVTPKAMPIKFAGKRVSAAVIVGAHLLLWLAASVLVWFLFTSGGIS